MAGSLELQPYQKKDVMGYYKLLGVSPTATTAEIRKAYYALALIYHPDKNSSKDAELMFKAIVQAYDVLSDPEKRLQYDSLTYSFDNRYGETYVPPDVPSFLFGALLGNIFIAGASAGIIAIPLWGWILAPTLLLVVVTPTLIAKKYVKLSAFCCGLAIAPLTAAEIGLKLTFSFVSGVVGYITSRQAKHEIEDIEEGWVEVGEE